MASLSGNLIYRSQSESNRVNFLAVEDHICLIKNLNLLFSNFLCSNCDTYLKSARILENHFKTCVEQTKHIYPGGKYSPSFYFLMNFN